MTIAQFRFEPPALVESVDERQARIVRERAMITAAMARMDAGHGIELDDFEDWLENLGVNDDAPLPGPRSSAD